MKDGTKHTKTLNSSKKLSCLLFLFLEVKNSLTSLTMLRTTRHPDKMYAMKINIFLHIRIKRITGKTRTKQTYSFPVQKGSSDHDYPHPLPLPPSQYPGPIPQMSLL